MQEFQGIWVVNLEGLLQRARPGPKGEMTLNLRAALPPEDLQRIGNYKPLIVTAPSPTAQTFAQAFSALFQKAPIITSWVLECSYEEVLKQSERILESIDLKGKEKYKVKIFIPEL